MMKMVAYDKGELMQGVYKRTKNQKLLMEFVNGEADCVRVDGWTQKTAASCANSFRESIKRFRLTGIQVIVRKEAVYLVKTTK